MNKWLFKEEPSHFSFDDLLQVRQAVWDGVENALARKYLRQVKKGDQVLFYHTGKEKAVVGQMEVVRGPYADPDSDDPKSVVVNVRAVARLPRPVLLSEIKAMPELTDFLLVRMSRLSVMPVTPAQWAVIMRRARRPSTGGGSRQRK
jgi:predicted RNA-binding protein with PUA-like domain